MSSKKIGFVYEILSNCLHLNTSYRFYETWGWRSKNAKHKFFINNGIWINCGCVLAGECGKLFVRKSALDTHMKCHMGVKPWACNYCDKTFTQKVTRDIHLLTHTRRYPFTSFLLIFGNMCYYFCHSLYKLRIHLLHLTKLVK